MKLNSQMPNVAETMRAPRYTSYPPANHFNASVGPFQMARWLQDIPPGSDLSLYIHIPFCRKLCWFCACRTQGVRRTEPLFAYVEALKAELDVVADLIDPSVRVGFLHLGGGTPTILPTGLMADLIDHVHRRFAFAKNAAFAVEIDPTELDQDRLDGLVDSGMSRVSIGVQDFNPIIQKAIGRRQSPELTDQTVAMIRQAGIGSINIDLLYGLPHQTEKSFAKTLDQITALDPDRVAMFGYAHVPWVARRQVMIDEQSLPTPESRRLLLDLGRRHFLTHGLIPVGIDHFAKPQDSLAGASRSRRLHRNFQGYTDDPSAFLIGVGASAISRLPQGYAQNAAGTSTYQSLMQNCELATSRGHHHSDDDQLRGYVIEQLMCHFGLSLPELGRRFGWQGATLAEEILKNAKGLGFAKDEDDGWLGLTGEPHVTARLVALHFDKYHAAGAAHSLAV